MKGRGRMGKKDPKDSEIASLRLSISLALRDIYTHTPASIHTNVIVVLLSSSFCCTDVSVTFLLLFSLSPPFSVPFFPTVYLPPPLLLIVFLPSSVHSVLCLPLPRFPISSFIFRLMFQLRLFPPRHHVLPPHLRFLFLILRLLPFLAFLVSSSHLPSFSSSSFHFFVSSLTFSFLLSSLSLSHHRLHLLLLPFSLSLHHLLLLLLFLLISFSIIIVSSSSSSLSPSSSPSPVPKDLNHRRETNQGFVSDIALVDELPRSGMIATSSHSFINRKIYPLSSPFERNGTVGKTKNVSKTL